MSNRRTALAVTLLLATLGLSRDPAWRVSLHGIGPVRLGMTFTEACNAIGASDCDKLPETNSESGDCTDWLPYGHDFSATFTLEGGKVVVVGVLQGDTRTVEDIGIGSTRAEVDKAYAPHLELHETMDYFELIHRSDAPADAEYQVRFLFDLDTQTVTAFKAGIVPAVEWVEGCL